MPLLLLTLPSTPSPGPSANAMKTQRIRTKLVRYIPHMAQGKQDKKIIEKVQYSTAVRTQQPLETGQTPAVDQSNFNIRVFTPSATSSMSP